MRVSGPRSTFIHSQIKNAPEAVASHAMLSQHCVAPTIRNVNETSTHFSMDDFSAHDGLSLAALVRNGEVSPRELVTSSIERIESLNPKLNAVIHRMYDS